MPTGPTCVAIPLTPSRKLEVEDCEIRELRRVWGEPSEACEIVSNINSTWEQRKSVRVSRNPNKDVIA